MVIFHISSTEEEPVCSYCGEKSNKVHSFYEREISDLPIMDKQSVLLVKTCKMFCNNQACSKKTFSERYRFVDPKGKRTLRLEKNIIYTSTQVSSVNASKLLKAANINISKSSICELLKKMPSVVDNLSVKKICVDDFALRKRFSYGTVMVDIDTHRIIDMIPSRDTKDVKTWLEQYTNIDIIQVSDRFHLIKGLSEATDKYIIRTYPGEYKYRR